MTDSSPASAEVEEPIINSPYEEPQAYWKISPHEPPQKINARRPPTYFYIPPGTPPEAQGEKSVEVEIHKISTIRKRLGEWREDALKGKGGVTRVTMELLNYWRREGRMQPLFFTQLEAAETIIFLTEARADFLQGIDIPLDAPGEEKLKEGFNAFQRLCCKMATGAGKTTVMAMLAAWSILNKVNNKSDKRFSKSVLVVCPNVTIRERLAELNPQKGEASIYRTRDLVPLTMMPQLVQGKVLTVNWHVFEPQSAGSGKVMKAGKRVIVSETIHIGDKTQNARGKRYMTEADLRKKSALGLLDIQKEHTIGGALKKADVKSEKYIESDTAVVKRVLAHELGETQNILVINDEAHHAYRLHDNDEAEESGDVFGEEEAGERYYKEATVWVDGLDKVHKYRGINMCVDFSATPYFIGRAGKETNRIFPWTVSNFGLQDAIESGLVKIPQLAARDTSGSPVPGYFNIWKWILPQLSPAERGGKKSDAKPEAVLKYAHTPLAMLGGMWEALRKDWGETDDKRPPVFIIVCKTKKLADVVYQWLAEDTPPTAIIPKAHLPALKNDGDTINTIRVYSEMQDEIDSGNTKSNENRWMRYTLDTIGKTDWLRDSQGRALYPTDFEALAKKLGREQFLEYPPGRDVRCIVSVSMLTEGWDCNTVTHIIGLRPFMSQLLCEQVIGRGLRRASYDVEENGLMSEEIATVLGVPLSIFPVKSTGKGEKKEKIEKHHIYAVSENKQHEIIFPRVEGYRQHVRNRLFCDLNNTPSLTINIEQIPPEVELKAGFMDNQGRVSIHAPGGNQEATLNDFRRQCRLQQRIFEMTQALVAHYQSPADCTLPANVLFMQLYRIVSDYVAKKVFAHPPADKKDAFMSPYYGYIIEILRENIQPDETAGDAPELPRYETSRGNGSTADVDFWTRREPYPVMKSHINAVVPDTKRLEQTTAYRLDNNPRVAAFAKNEGLGFGIPYLHDGTMHDYMPDFIVRLDNEKHLILETKGYDPLKEIKAAAAKRWVNAVNGDGQFGKWDYAMITKSDETNGVIEKSLGQ